MAIKKKTFTKRVMVLSSVRLQRHDRNRAVEAAAKLGISVSELIRNSIREKTAQVLEELKLSA
jgi:predicted HicB family RNase H-like nuclease